MYFDTEVDIPLWMSGISRKTIGGTQYIYYTYGREQVPGRSYTAPRNACIGKAVPGNPDRMLPNERFSVYFPQGFPSSQGDEVEQTVRAAVTAAQEKARQRTSDRLVLLRLMDLCSDLYRSIRESERELGMLRQQIRNLGVPLPEDFPLVEDDLPEIPSSWLT